MSLIPAISVAGGAGGVADTVTMFVSVTNVVVCAGDAVVEA